jgi:hypothetical protein
MAQDTHRISILLEEYKNQNEWQRHNENQRAQLASILLAISAALVTLLPKDKPLTRDDWPIPALLTIIGVFGILAVMKYWERFVYHVRLERAHRKVLDSYFENHLLIKTREDAIEKHNKGWRPLFKDRHLMQHWLWEGVFALITLLGIYFLARVLSLI